jgi:hypothetical protein
MPENSPFLDEFAYHLGQQPPVNGTPGMPQRAYPPIQLPGLLSPRTAPSMPEGYSYGDDSVLRDPTGAPAEFLAPSRRSIANDLMEMVQPTRGVLAKLAKQAASKDYGQERVDELKREGLPNLFR